MLNKLDTPFEPSTNRQSPFDVIAVTASLPAARALATAFATSHQVTDVWAALRFHMRWDGSDLTGYLDGAVFAYWQDRSGEMNDLAVADLRDMASEWLEARR